jgi:hypothetical protein
LLFLASLPLQHDEVIAAWTYHLLYFNSLYTGVNPTKIAGNIRKDQDKEVSYQYLRIRI